MSRTEIAILLFLQERIIQTMEINIRVVEYFVGRFSRGEQKCRGQIVVNK